MYELITDIYTNQYVSYAYDYVNSNYIEDIVNQRFTISYVFILNEYVTA